MQDLIKQYNTTLRQLREAQKDAKEEDVKVLTDMISDITYSLEWMKRREDREIVEGLKG